LRGASRPTPSTTVTDASARSSAPWAVRFTYPAGM
jgi:hypothetical protein